VVERRFRLRPTPHYTPKRKTYTKKPQAIAQG
jgi:hypothetical protein